MGPLVIPLIAAGSVLAGGVANLLGSRYQTKKTNTANMKLAEYQYSKDLEMWNAQNAYNSPSAQMERYQEAGLNPNLIYGNGASAGNASSAPSYNAPRIDEHYQLPNFSNLGVEMINLYQGYQMNKAQIDNVKAQTAATQQRTLNDSIQNAILQSELVPKAERAKWIAENYHLFGQGIELKEYALPIQKLYQEQIRWNQMQELLNQAKEVTTQTKIKTSIMNEDLLFKQYENDLRKMGITSSDHPALRVMVRLINELGINPMENFKSVK